MKLVVVGGVAAGASTAARARRLSEAAEIVVLERGQHVSFANCGLPYHIGGAIAEREALLLQTPETLRQALNLDVRVGAEVLSIDRQKKQVQVRELESGRVYHEGYDKLVLCPGAVPVVPPIPGVAHPRVMCLRNIEDMDRVKGVVETARSAVVIGAGYIGVEMAESLRERGLAVDLVEMAPQIMPPLDREMVRSLEDHMRHHGVRLHLGTVAVAFKDRGSQVGVELQNGTTLVADLVMMSAGVRPESALAKEAGLSLGARGGIVVDAQMRTSDPDIFAAGDAVEVQHTVTGERLQIPLAGPANRQGRIAAEVIMGRDSSYSSTQGTAIVKIFAMTAGGTGASERQLRQAGVPYAKVYLHPSGHAGYYPGTAPMHLKVMYAPEDGRLLGAQVVGFDGVDKRIDVLATALRFGMKVEDLESLELAYAPPYGSAKDPVNMVGFVANNVLRGDTQVWYAEAYPEQTRDGVVVDVRGAEEFDLWHIPGSIHLPLGELRARVAELPKDKMLFLVCKSGFRSYLAYRVLSQLGYRCATLSGGVQTFCAWHGTGVCGGQPEIPILSYAEEKMAAVAQATGKVLTLDCAGMQCPGPIMKLSQAMETQQIGDEVAVTASDPGFASDVQAWCQARGHALVSLERDGARTQARVRKGGALGLPLRPGAKGEKKTMVVFSGDLDKVMAAFIIANGAASMGAEVTMFFTFWGLNALRRAPGGAVKKGLLERTLAWMMPSGAGKLKLSQMHWLGAGTAALKQVMAAKKVESLPELMSMAQGAGVKLVACAMSMDLLGIQPSELIDGVEMGGVATFLGESRDAGMTLFI